MERKDYTKAIYEWLRDDYKERAMFVLMGEFKEEEKPRRSFCFGGSPEKLISLLVDTMDTYPELYDIFKSSMNILDNFYKEKAKEEVILP